MDPWPQTAGEADHHHARGTWRSRGRRWNRQFRSLLGVHALRKIKQRLSEIAIDALQLAGEGGRARPEQKHRRDRDSQ